MRRSAGAGLFVEPEKPAALAEAILKLRNAPVLCARLGRSALKRQYARDVLAKRMLEALQSCRLS